MAQAGSVDVAVGVVTGVGLGRVRQGAAEPTASLRAVRSAAEKMAEPLPELDRKLVDRQLHPTLGLGAKLPTRHEVVAGRSAYGVKLVGPHVGQPDCADPPLSASFVSPGNAADDVGDEEQEEEEEEEEEEEGEEEEDVQVLGETTWAERDAQLRSQAVDVLEMEEMQVDE